MKIGIIGSGNIGGNLGKLLTRAGYEVKFSSRHPDQLKDLAKEAGEMASVGTIQEAAKFGDAIILSVPFWANKEVANAIEPFVKDKTIIETTNPFPGRDGDEAQRWKDSGKSSSEFMAQYFPEAHVVKAFNAIYYKNLVDQSFQPEGKRRAIPYAGDHQSSLDLLKQLISDIGFDPIYVGKLSESRIMEPNQPFFTRDLSAREMKELLAKSVN